MSKTRDLGTYFVRVEFETGEGFVMEWHTGSRFVGGGSGDCMPFGATRVDPLYENEEDLFRNIEFQFTDGNYSCDCNLKSFLDRACQRELDEEGPDYQCGDTMKIKKITAIRPDGSEQVLFPVSI
jgi:hypothetical protein